jgi:uncharacterized protein (TIGR02271 family)
MSQISNVTGGTLTAMFDSRHDAEDAVRRLVDAGIPQSNVRLMPGYEADEPTTDTSEVHKGFFASLADFFMPDEDRYSYAEGLRRGGYMVTVSDVGDNLRERAIDILDDEGAINLDEREEAWRSEGWSGYTGSGLSDTGSASYGSSATTSGLGSSAGTAGFGSSAGLAGTGGLTAGSNTGAGFGTTSTGLGRGEEVIPVVEEELRIGKRDVNLGRVRVRSYVREIPVNEQVNLRSERVEVERRAVDRPLTTGDVAFQDRTIEAEERAEEAVVAKEARVTEEIALRKEAETRTETVTDSVRKTEVEVEDERGLRNTGLGDNNLNSRR